MAKFEGGAAADKFARRHSTYHRAVRQSIPAIRFNEHGVPISTRQRIIRSQSLEGAGIKGDAEQNTRKLSRSLFAEGNGGGAKANFMTPSTITAGLLGSNRRWSIRPDWMTNKRISHSVKEKFIEKNMKNVQIPQLSLSRRSDCEETDRKTPYVAHQALEDISDESDGLGVDFAVHSGSSESEGTESGSSNFVSCLSSELEDENSDSDGGYGLKEEVYKEDEEIFVEAVENVSEIATQKGKKELAHNLKEKVQNVVSHRRQSNTERRRSKIDKRSNGDSRQSHTGGRHSKLDRGQANLGRRGSNADRKNFEDRRSSAKAHDTHSATRFCRDIATTNPATHSTFSW